MAVAGHIVKGCSRFGKGFKTSTTPQINLLLPGEISNFRTTRLQYVYTTDISWGRHFEKTRGFPWLLIILISRILRVLDIHYHDSVEKCTADTNMYQGISILLPLPLNGPELTRYTSRSRYDRGIEVKASNLLRQTVWGLWKFVQGQDFITAKEDQDHQKSEGEER